MEEEFKPEPKADLFENFKPKTAFFLGLIGGALVLGTIGFLIMLATSFGNRNSNIAQQNNPVVQPGTVNADTTADQQPNFSAIRSVDSKDNIQGSKNAKVTIIEYSDFECPYCASVVPTLQRVLQEYNGKVRVIFRYLPLSFHPYAAKAAEAAQCAAEQGKFWEMHDKLFTEQSALDGSLKKADAPQVAGRIIVPTQSQTGIVYVDITDALASIKQFAQGLSLNMNKFNSCLDDGKMADKVAKDVAEAEAVLPQQLYGTPAIFLNNKEFLPGAYPFEDFKKVIDRLLAE